MIQYLLHSDKVGHFFLEETAQECRAVGPRVDAVARVVVPDIESHDLQGIRILLSLTVGKKNDKEHGDKKTQFLHRKIILMRYGASLTKIIKAEN
jgi:hypothetical protein